MFAALTPQSLIQERVAAFQRHDFSAIFESYLADAPFRQFFPDCASYRLYAEAEIAGIFVIESCQIIRVKEEGGLAFVLFSQRLHHRGTTFESVEIARCQQVAGDMWYFAAGLRLDPSKLPADILLCPWEELFALGNDLWI